MISLKICGGFVEQKKQVKLTRSLFFGKEMSPELPFYGRLMGGC
jgi:hypothetical protein